MWSVSRSLETSSEKLSTDLRWETSTPGIVRAHAMRGNLLFERERTSASKWMVKWKGPMKMETWWWSGTSLELEWARPLGSSKATMWKGSPLALQSKGRMSLGPVMGMQLEGLMATAWSLSGSAMGLPLEELSTAMPWILPGLATGTQLEEWLMATLWISSGSARAATGTPLE